MHLLLKQTHFIPSSLFTRSLLSLSLVQRFIPNKWKTIPTYQTSNHITNTFDSDQSHFLQESLNTFISQGDLSSAFKTFYFLQLHTCYSTSSRPFLIIHSVSSLLQSCTTLKTLLQGKQLHAHTIHFGLQYHPILVPKLVTFYASFNLLCNAHYITESSNLWYTLPWNVLISAYVKNGLSGLAIDCYKQMISMGIRPDKFTYPSVLKACGEELDLEFGIEVHISIDGSDIEWDLFVQNALVTMYAKCGEIVVARKLFDGMPKRDVVSWNSMISGYASKNRWEEVLQLSELMELEGFERNVIFWNTIAGRYLQMGKFEEALELISQMKNYGCHVDSIAIVIGLGACSQTGLIKLGKEIHGYAIRNHYDGVESVRNALITMYSRCKNLRYSCIVFQTTEAKSVVTWNSMIGCYAHMDRYDEVSFLFREMIDNGGEPNFVTIASILPLCARVANLQHGKELHCYILRCGVLKNYLLLWNSLVDMYSKSGKVLEARRIFDTMCQKDEVTYTSLIAGLGMQGKGKIALQLFQEMIEQRIKPDHITMVAILSACSRSGLVAEGERLFSYMISLYGIERRLEHYACMVDLFGRAGMLRRAMQIIKVMPFQPTADMWVTIIGACRIHGCIDIGEWAAEKLLEMRPQNSGYYVLIANMYAAAGCSSKVAYVRTLMRDLDVRKTPGCALIDIGNGFHPFSVGDTSSPLALDIIRLLYGLSRLTKEAGYVGNDSIYLSDKDFEE